MNSNSSRKYHSARNKPIYQTPCSGEHKDIKDGIGADARDNVKIDPKGDVWLEHPNGKIIVQQDHILVLVSQVARLGKIVKKDKEKTTNKEICDQDYYNFDLRFYIKHRNKSLEFIQAKIPLPMTNGWSIGSERKAPNGKILGGVRNETYWNYRIKVKNRRDFFNYAITFLNNLIGEYDLADFLKNLHRNMVKLTWLLI